MKECKLYDELLDKVSLETKTSVPRSSGKDKPVSIFILQVFISSICNNHPTYSSSLLLSYKLLLFSLVSKQPLVKIEEIGDNIDTNVEIQLSCYKLKILEQIKKRNLVQDLHKRTQQSSQYKTSYLIYARLLVCTIVPLVYSERLHIIYQANICKIYYMILFQNLLQCSFVIYDYITFL